MLAGKYFLLPRNIDGQVFFPLYIGVVYLKLGSLEHLKVGRCTEHFSSLQEAKVSTWYYIHDVLWQESGSGLHHNFHCQKGWLLDFEPYEIRRPLRFVNVDDWIVVLGPKLHANESANKSIYLLLLLHVNIL